MPRRGRVIDFYDRHAEEFARRYEAIPFERAHGRIINWLPDSPGIVLDVGAGSGRDAAWFAAYGHKVFAVEPATGLRKLAAALHPSPNIHWIDSRLPELASLSPIAQGVDLVWVSPVWMHLAPEERRPSFCTLIQRTRPGGRMIISLRHGEFSDGREAHSVSVAEIEVMAAEQGIDLVAVVRSDDAAGRLNLAWEHVVLLKPSCVERSVF